MESSCDDNLNPDNDCKYTVTTCRCLVFQSLCKLSLFSSFVVGNELSPDTVYAHCAKILQSALHWVPVVSVVSTGATPGILLLPEFGKCTSAGGKFRKVVVRVWGYFAFLLGCEK